MPFSLPAGGGGAAADYRIARSLRFNSADSTRLSKASWSTATDTKKCTVSAWVKRCGLAAIQYIQSSYDGVSTFGTHFLITAAGQLSIEFGGIAARDVTTAALLRDPGAWMHVFAAIDTTQATAANRIKLWLNGVQQTSLAAANYPALNDVHQFFANSKIGSVWTGAATFADLYLSEYYFIDGQQLEPSSFGVADATTGVWGPKLYTGAYGTNGFKLDFADNSAVTAATLGKDTSGNGNNWTPNAFSVTAGLGNDSLVDTPTSYGSDSGAGGEVRGNYCTLNPLRYLSNLPADGNLVCGFGSGITINTGTFSVSSGKWFWEVNVATSTASELLGILPASMHPLTVNGTDLMGYYPNGQKIRSGVTAAYGAAFTTGDIIGVALDCDTGTLAFYKNGATQGVAYSGLSGDWQPMAQFGVVGDVVYFNFGQRPFSYAAPAGFKALCTQNLVTPAIKRGDDYMTVNTRTGTGAAFSVTGKRFQPSLVWIKGRSGVTSHSLFDVVRGATLELQSASTNAESAEAQGVIAFNADGFSGGTRVTINTNTASYVDWIWKEGVVPGFDIVTYTGNGANRTVAHNLGVAPTMMIVKGRQNAFDWRVYHAGIGATADIQLNLTAAYSASTVWNNTVPTASVFSLGAGSAVNESGLGFVNYLFADVPGFSKFGSYTGNGNADGPFVWTGFRPRWLLIKNAVGVTYWHIYDSVRGVTNVIGPVLYPNILDAEVSDTRVDFLSNGFKIRATADPNVSGSSHVYAAFAEHPFKYARAR